MGEKPQKRLVGWTEFADRTGEKGIRYVLATVFGCGGLIALLAALGSLFLALFRDSQGDVFGAICSYCVSLVIGGVGVGGIACARFLMREARQFESVGLLTKSSAKRLPEVETLVRASDLPPSQPQVELLRGAAQGPETPSEELLRVAKTPEQDA